jgi:uncharacterized protein with von Willebrand factor type A (vWA) domain
MMRLYSESIGAIGSSEKKDILMVIRELPRKEFDKLRSFELDYLKKVIEKYGGQADDSRDTRLRKKYGSRYTAQEGSGKGS